MAAARPSEGARLSAADVVRFLSTRRFSLSDEKALQVEMFAALVAGGFDAKREVTLGVGDIIDFTIDGHIGIEVKIKGAKRAIFHQVERYAAHDSIHELILASNVAMGFPPSINGKPTYFLHLGRAWL